MRRMRFSALLLSALLHVAPLMRLAVAESVGAAAPLMTVLRWLAGVSSVAGAFHAVSAASGMVVTQGGATVTSAKGTSGAVLSGVRVTMFSLFGAPRAFTFIGLPPGLNGSAQGVITGIPNTPGSYSVTVFGWELPNATGNLFAASLPFTIAAGVPDPPVITAPPADQTLAAGSTLSLSVAVTGSGVSYQWRKDGADIPGPAGTSAVYSVGSVQLVDAGRYTVLVSNSGGSVESAGALVTVVAPPVFSVPLLSQTVVAGAPATFAASVVGTGLIYQWFKDSNPIPAPDGTGPTLLIPSAQPANAGVYSLTVSNLGGSVSSGDVNLTVLTAPVFQFPLVGRTVIQGSLVSLAVAVSGEGLAYQWFKDEVAIPGPKGTSPTLALGAVTGTDAGSYRITVSNAAGSASSGPATLVVVTPPVMTTPPQPVTVAEGAAAQLRVEATGGDLAYQWSKDSTPIPAPLGTAAVLSFNPAKASDAGSYVVTVSNAAGSATSVAVQVTVVGAPVITLQPSPVSVKVGAPFTLTGAASGTGLSYQWVKGTVLLPEGIGTSPTLSIAAATPADAGEYVLRVANAAGVVSSLPVAVTVTPSALQPSLLANLIEGSAHAGESVTFTVRVSATEPVTYRWMKNGVILPDATGSTLVIDSVQPTDSGSYRVEVSAGGIAGTTPVVELTVLPKPVLTLEALSPELGATLAFSSVPGRRYVVEELQSVAAAGWSEVSEVVADSAISRVTVAPSAVDVRVWRIRVQPVAP